MHRRILRIALGLGAVIALVAITGCATKLPGSTPLNVARTKAGSDFESAKKAARSTSEGVFAPSEADCAMDKLFARSDITLDQIKQFNKAPDLQGPVQKAYQESVPACIDEHAVVAPKPLSAEVRAGLIKGFLAASPSITETQATCVLDHLGDQGLTVRDLVLAGYKPELAAVSAPKIGAIFTSCKGG